jgi:hypothetical protein
MLPEIARRMDLMSNEAPDHIDQEHDSEKVKGDEIRTAPLLCSMLLISNPNSPNTTSVFIQTSSLANV